MKLTKKDITSLVETGRMAGMPKGMYVAGFHDCEGRYYPIYTLDSFFYVGVDCELYTHLTHALGGTVFYLRFFF